MNTYDTHQINKQIRSTDIAPDTDISDIMDTKKIKPFLKQPKRKKMKIIENKLFDI